MRTPQLKTRLTSEIVVLVLLTTLFLLVFPKRHMFLDVSLALFALGLLALDARFTRTQVWARIPSQVPERERLQKCLSIVIPVTVLLLVVCFITGFSISYMQGGWEAAMARVGNWRILLAVAFYLPWALLQQTLFQFYLVWTSAHASTAAACCDLYRLGLWSGASSRSGAFHLRRDGGYFLELCIQSAPPFAPSCILPCVPRSGLSLLGLRSGPCP